jgi:pimeloyl-ACP methyl ester carboxylesterase
MQKKHRHKIGWLFIVASLGLTTSCGDDSDKHETSGSGATDGDDAGPTKNDEDVTKPLPSGCERLVNDADCDKSLRPIVFVHGTTANGDSFAHPAMILASNGYCPDRIRAVEYHSLVAAPANADAPPSPTGFTLDREETYRRASADIDRVIAELQAETGFEKVDLAGHSQGSGHGSKYAGEHPDKVEHYVHLAGGQLEADPGGVPTLCVSSIGDRPVECKTTKNVTFQDNELDHSGVSSSTESALEVYRFLTGQEPKYDSVQCGSSITLEGRAPTFADNTFLVGAKVEMYELDFSKGARERGAPLQTATLTDNGKFGPWQAKPGVYYEFKLLPPPDDNTRRPAHAYLTPFIRSDRLLRFNFETKDPVASATSSKINRDPTFAIVIPRSLQKAFLFNRDSLEVDGTQIISEDTTWNTMTNHSRVTVAYYLFDKSETPDSFGPGDMKSTLESIVSGSFVNSADLFMQAETPAWIEVKYNDTTLKVPNWPSATEGASVVFLN